MCQEFCLEGSTSDSWGGVCLPLGPVGCLPLSQGGVHSLSGRHPLARYPPSRHPLDIHPPQADTPWADPPFETATAAEVTHPIGMHSCYHPQRKFAKVIFLHVSVILSRDQVHPLGPGTPPGTRYTPRTRYIPLGPGTPQDQVHPTGPGTPPKARYTPTGPGTPPGTRHIPRACWEIWETSGRYASYWNAFLSVNIFKIFFA